MAPAATVGCSVVAVDGRGGRATAVGAAVGRGATGAARQAAKSRNETRRVIRFIGRVEVSAKGRGRKEAGSQQFLGEDLANSVSGELLADGFGGTEVLDSLKHNRMTFVTLHWRGS